MKVIEGKLISRGYKFALVVSRFNEFISSRLLEGALDCLKRHNVNDEDIILGSLPLFHAFGRVGCFLTGCCYGKELSNSGLSTLIRTIFSRTELPCIQ